MIAALILAAMLPANLETQTATVAIDVYTMGDGDDIFAHFGHAAICIATGEVRDRCFNYGTADFSTPIPLTWDFIRGRARFWVSTTDHQRMIAWYVKQDRTVWKQRLPLDAKAAHRLASALEQSTEERLKYYRYHHFLDNCTTRIRDHLDVAVEGALSRKTQSSRANPSFREYAKRGFAGSAPLLVAANVILGRISDEPTTDWDAMFLPEVFRRELEEELRARPVAVYERKQPLDARGTWQGDALLIGAGIALAFLILASRIFGPRAGRFGRSIAGIIGGTFAAILWLLAIVSAFEELRDNELLVILVPFDVLLGAMSGRALKFYLYLRLAILVLAVVFFAFGVLVQPLAPALVLAGAPLLAAVIVERRSS